jgi:hypothetical protein
MGAGKILCIIGGIITLLATYLFSFATPFIFGLGFVMNVPLWFSTGDILIIIMTIVFIIFLLAGLFIILGLKSRAIAIIGSIFAIVVAVYFILSFFGMLPLVVSQFVLLFVHPPLVPGIIPLDVPLGLVGPSLGTYLLLGGGVLGLIGGIMGPDGY